MRTISRFRWSVIYPALWTVLASVPLPAAAEFHPSGNLEIHYINIGQGGSTLIIGPNGTRILYDFGNVDGRTDIVPYLTRLGILPEDGLDYAIVSHEDRDHYVGYIGLIETGYDVNVANYGSNAVEPTRGLIREKWFEPAETTTAGAVRLIPVGLRISLGDGAEAIAIAAGGRIHGGRDPIDTPNTNDRSLVLFVTYGNFQYILDGDLGSGPEACTSHQTRQKDLQTRVASALISLGLMSAERGVDVLHIGHHGSESSTSAAYFNMVKPEVGLISVGSNQGSFLHPREDVVDKVLIGDHRADCVEAPPLRALFQTEDGVEGCSSTGCTSFTGLSIGDIKVVTDGRTGYTITGSNRVHRGSQEALPAGQSWEFDFDEGGPVASREEPSETIGGLASLPRD